MDVQRFLQTEVPVELCDPSVEDCCVSCCSQAAEELNDFSEFFCSTGCDDPNSFCLGSESCLSGIAFNDPTVPISSHDGTDLCCTSAGVALIGEEAQLCLVTNLPTAQPTTSPTFSPAGNPTISPTNAPVVSPVPSPTTIIETTEAPDPSTSSLPIAAIAGSSAGGLFLVVLVFAVCYSSKSRSQVPNVQPGGYIVNPMLAQAEAEGASSSRNRVDPSLESSDSLAPSGISSARKEYLRKAADQSYQRSIFSPSRKYIASAVKNQLMKSLGRKESPPNPKPLSDLEI